MSTKVTTSPMRPSAALELFHAARSFEAALADQLISALSKTEFKEINAAQLRFLAALICGENTASDIARSLGVSRQAAQRQVAEMVAANLLDLSTDPAARNRKIVTFTDRGTRLMSECREILAKLDTRLQGDAGPVATDTAIAILKTDLT